MILQSDNPIRMVRELKGAPLSIVMVLSLVHQRVTQEFLERATGYTDKPVSQALALHGFQVHEREARVCINQLRKEGVQICSTGGGDGGYWLAENLDELEEYLNNEPLARIKDLSDQVNAMRAAAQKRWGKYSPAKQTSMF